MQISIRPAMVFLLLALCLAGCDRGTPEAVLSNYLERVSNTLDTDAEDGNPYEALRPLPPRRERRLPISELRAGLLESLDFADCGLLPLIAERNSSLGKVMKPSTLLSYELRFFDRLDPCHRHHQVRPSRDKEFSRLLKETWQVKSENLEAVVWNGLFTSEALERNFSLSREPLPLAGNPGFGDSQRALKAFQNIVDLLSDYRRHNRYHLNNELNNLEKHYFALHTSEYGSQLLKSLALLSHYLNRAAAVLERSVERRPLCFNGRATEKARFLKNVFIRYYAGEVQPYMAMVQRQGESWLLQTNDLLDENKLPVPAVMRHYREQMLDMRLPGSPWSDYQQAIHRHTSAWQTVLDQCGLMPGGNQ